MSDKELLEFAAKAAGINGSYVEDDDWYGTGIVYTDPDDVNQCWNPLTDDGDVFRLAVKLSKLDGGLALFINSRLNSFGVIQCYTNDSVVSPAESTHDDPYAATRRAIVRAAAEIGKAM